MGWKTTNEPSSDIIMASLKRKFKSPGRYLIHSTKIEPFDFVKNLPFDGGVEGLMTAHTSTCTVVVFIALLLQWGT